LADTTSKNAAKTGTRASRLHAGDEVFAAARHDHVERAVESGEHHAHGRAPRASARA